MERVWLFDSLAVSVADIDFLDPAHASEPDARERGVRVEIRTAAWTRDGTVYVSPTVTLEPAVCRIDLLESRPGAADRMHWHPSMTAGEPGERVFDAAIPDDPLSWLAARLRDVDGLLKAAGVDDRRRHTADVPAIAARADNIVDSVRAGLAAARIPWPWPDIARDSRGLARL